MTPEVSSSQSVVLMEPTAKPPHLGHFNGSRRYVCSILLAREDSPQQDFYRRRGAREYRREDYP
jgi:hypothetical protein